MDTNRITALINAQVELIEQYRAANVAWRDAQHNYNVFKANRKPSDYAMHIESELQREMLARGIDVDRMGTRLLGEFWIAIPNNYDLHDLSWRIVEAYASEILPDNGAMVHEIYAEIMGSYRLVWSNNPDAPASLTQSNPPYTYALRDGILIAHLDNDSGLSYLPTRLADISPVNCDAHPLRGKHDFLAYTGE